MLCGLLWVDDTKTFTTFPETKMNCTHPKSTPREINCLFCAFVKLKYELYELCIFVVTHSDFPMISARIIYCVKWQNLMNSTTALMQANEWTHYYRSTVKCSFSHKVEAPFRKLEYLICNFGRKKRYSILFLQQNNKKYAKLLIHSTRLDSTRTIFGCLCCIKYHRTLKMNPFG